MRPSMRLALLAVLAAVGSFAALPASASAQAVTSVTCPSTFQVLHDDRIGPLRLNAGPYTITVLNSTRLSCASASDLFRQFLEDWNGRLPRPWVLDASSATFTRGAGNSTGFRVALASTPSGGGGGGRHPATGTACPGYFEVLHNDRIGRFRLRAGNYRITLLSVGAISCSRASSYFAQFLQDYDGRLPRPWSLDTATGTFMRASRNVGFRVKPAVGPPPSPSGGGTHPSDGSRCPGTFRVLHNDMIGRLRLAAGPYIVTLLRGGGLSCSAASARLRQFLEAAVLPRPWVVSLSDATFTRGRGSRTGFRIKPARP